VKQGLLHKTVGLGGKTSVAYNGVDRFIFHPRPDEDRKKVCRALSLPPGKKIIGFVGRYEVWKGHETFLETVRRLLAERGDLFFLIVGGAITEEVAPQVRRYRDAILSRIRTMNLNGSLLMLGHRDDIPEIMAALDVYVCSSDYEPFGLVVLEAYESGVPVVISRTVGATEVLKHWEGVFIAEPRDASSFASCIAEALEYANRRRSDEPADHTPGTLSWRDYARTFEQLYASV
jgi:glycosyltransferase involved in cell wall biosynthesis